MSVFSFELVFLRFPTLGHEKIILCILLKNGDLPSTFRSA